MWIKYNIFVDKENKMMYFVCGFNPQPQNIEGGERVNIQMIDNKRKEQRYTVTEFCKQIGIDRTTYYNFLKNPESMKISTWNKIADLLNLTVAEKKECLK